MDNECRVTAVIKEVKGGTIAVETEPEGVCACCEAKILCGAAKKGLFTIAAQAGFKQGDRVYLSVPAKPILTAVLMLYATGVVVGIAVTFFISVLLECSGTVSAVSFLLFIAIWFILASIFFGKSINKRITVSLAQTSDIANHNLNNRSV